jgi:hypothetical protein
MKDPNENVGRNEEDAGFDEWLSDMSDREQPEVCNLDDPDCENCGS